MRVLAIDQGTTGSRAIIYDAAGQVIADAYREFKQHYPQPGWVEHDPEDIWQSIVDTVTAALAKSPGPVDAVGITNQRETTVVWDRETGNPIYNAIVWQCRRTAERCQALVEHAELIRAKTGLPLDAYFSGTKINWILENVKIPDVDRLLCGTIDTWLIWKLTGGQVHATDYTNASRTLLFNIKDRKWDDELCSILSVPASLLPTVKRSMDDYGTVTTIEGLLDVPILGVAGDQQAALFGQTCFADGQTKSTYGTGAFLLMNTGSRAVASANGLLTTLAVDADGAPCYALEGSVFIAGAALQWLRDELQLIESAADSEAAARSVPDNAGVYLVPAFVGLGAPHWDMDARGVLVGLTRGANRQHIIRATLESIAYQTADVLTAMQQDTGAGIETLAVDGGAALNDFLMQFQADMMNIRIRRPTRIETTSLGAAFLAGRQAGLWPDSEALLALQTEEREFTPSMAAEERQRLLDGWHKALRQARTR